MESEDHQKIGTQANTHIMVAAEAGDLRHEKKLSLRFYDTLLSICLAVLVLVLVLQHGEIALVA